jgi:hypothetical protein
VTSNDLVFISGFVQFCTVIQEILVGNGQMQVLYVCFMTKQGDSSCGKSGTQALNVCLTARQRSATRSANLTAVLGSLVAATGRWEG